MTNRNKRLGDEYERDVQDYFQANGWPGARRSLGAGRRDDMGDIGGVTEWCLQAKRWGQLSFPAWLKDVERQRQNADERFGAVIAKRRQKGVSESYVVMTLETFVGAQNAIQRLREQVLEEQTMRVIENETNDEQEQSKARHPSSRGGVAGIERFIACLFGEEEAPRSKNDRGGRLANNDDDHPNNGTNHNDSD